MSTLPSWLRTQVGGHASNRPAFLAKLLTGWCRASLAPLPIAPHAAQYPKQLQPLPDSIRAARLYMQSTAVIL